jgi:hypothetical protein
MTIVSDEEFIKAWGKHKSPAKLAREFGIAVRNVYDRRRAIEGRYGIVLSANIDAPVIEKYAARANCNIENGCAIVFSDAHFWSLEPSTAYTALLKFIEELKPQLIVANGDVFDGASISRHPSIGFMERKPSVYEELESCKAMMQGISDTAKGAFLTWTLGNHDARFENFIAANASQYEYVDGFHLKDHFQEWTPCWATWVNGDVVIKHRWKGGIHATHNNTMGAGKTIVTGHLHSLKVTPYTDYNGTRYGVDTGTLADPDGEQFLHYTEDNPKNWRSGFAVLTFYKGKLLPPETVQVISDGVVSFRGVVHDFNQ